MPQSFGLSAAANKAAGRRARRRSYFIRRALAVLLLTGAFACRADAGESPEESIVAAPRGFRTLFVTRSLAHERLMEYLKAARPEIVQVGNYGAMFHGDADNPRSTKSPMMLPVVGEREALKFQRQLNRRIHKLDLNVVGHFRLGKVMGDWEEQTGFVDYYNNRWPKDLLGEKPHPRLSELLQRDADGRPVQVSRYDNAQLVLCLSSPHTRAMLKAMLKCAIEHGVDGVVTNYNYRYDCACPYCQAAFKRWLQSRLEPAEIREKLGIEDLHNHTFKSIPARIPGYPDPAESSELDWLALRWGAEHFKHRFDEIFIDYGRSLRKDLIVAQWNHLSHVNIKEERMFLPAPLWGRGEDYFWYSGGASFVGKNLNLGEGKAGDAWLSSLCVREMGGGKPFVMGKYDRIRMAASMAEGFATGGSGMGRYMRFEQPAGFDVLARYTNFVHENHGLYEEARPYADVALVLPRQSVWQRRPESLDVFRELGQELIERQILLDVVADEKLTFERLTNYPAVVLPNVVALSDAQLAALRRYAAAGGLVLRRGETATVDETGKPRRAMEIDRAVAIPGEAIEAAGDFIETRLKKLGGCAISSPWTVRATAYHQPGRVVLHLVNYNRDESPSKQLQGPELERPLAAKNVRINLRLPPSRKAASVKLHTPDDTITRKLSFEQSHKNRVEFQVPSLRVYAVIAIDLQRIEAGNGE